MDIFTHHRLRLTPGRDARVVDWCALEEGYARSSCVDAAQLVAVVDEDRDEGLHDAECGGEALCVWFIGAGRV